MDTEVIYKKKYKHKDILTVAEYTLKAIPYTQKEKHAFKGYYDMLQSSIELVPIPERKRKCKKFICLAIATSKVYEIDTVIACHNSHISVDLSFDCGGGMKYLKALLAFADDYSFFTGINDREITICLDYYTHYVYKSGKRVAP